MWWTVYVTRMGRRMHIGFWWESQKEKEDQDDLDIVGG
jgi:hypothetical protein